MVRYVPGLGDQKADSGFCALGCCCGALLAFRFPLSSHHYHGIAIQYGCGGNGKGLYNNRLRLRSVDQKEPKCLAAKLKIAPRVITVSTAERAHRGARGVPAAAKASALPPLTP